VTIGPIVATTSCGILGKRAKNDIDTQGEDDVIEVSWPTMQLTEMERPTMHVLVVDDDDGIRKTLALLLEDEGYSVQTATDGRQALLLLHDAPVPRIIPP
jgi:PleD family two-component response regulator